MQDCVKFSKRLGEYLKKDSVKFSKWAIFLIGWKGSGGKERKGEWKERGNEGDEEKWGEVEG